MLEQQNNIEDIESKENVLLINNKSLLSKDKTSEINTNRKVMMNNIQEIK